MNFAKAPGANELKNMNKYIDLKQDQVCYFPLKVEMPTSIKGDKDQYLDVKIGKEAAYV